MLENHTHITPCKVDICAVFLFYLFQKRPVSLALVFFQEVIQLDIGDNGGIRFGFGFHRMLSLSLLKKFKIRL